MSIYNNSIPYFYIIRNKQTGMMYAGSRWAQGCYPEELLIKKGYKTSCPEILDIIKTFGTDIFEILRIDTYCDGLHPYEYETIFLQTNNCANSNIWYNKHNNDNRIHFSSEKFKTASKKTNLKRYGVEYSVQSEYIKQKIKQTNLEKYGVENPMQHNSIKQKVVDTCLDRYGVTHPMKSEKIKEKTKQTNLEKYGVEHYNNKEKIKQTALKKYGVENTSQLPEIVSKIKKTKLSKYGDETFNNKEKTKQTNLKRYGVESIHQIPEFKIKIQHIFIEKYGVNSPTKIKQNCCFCGEYKTLIHQSKCPKNPNKTPQRPRAIYKLKCPNNNIFTLFGRKELKLFCENNNISYYYMTKNKKHNKWEIIEIISV